MNSEKINRLAHRIVKNVLRAKGISVLAVHKRRVASATRVSLHLFGDDIRDAGTVFYFPSERAARHVLVEMVKTHRTAESEVRTVKVSDGAVNVFGNADLVIREAAARIGVLVNDQGQIDAGLETLVARLQPILLDVTQKRNGLALARRLWRQHRGPGEPFEIWYAARIEAMAANALRF